MPIDLHPLSEQKVPVAEAQARAFGAELILLHVLPIERSAEGVSPAEAQARTYLDAIAARMHAEGIAARPMVRFGPPVDTILQEIVETETNLVVLGRNVRHGLSRLFLGSVAEEVVARAPCPVLLVPSSGAVDEEVRTPVVRIFAEDQARAGPVAPRTLGLRTVEVARIVGSVGRAEELDANFRSISKARSEEYRYRRILQLMEEGAPLPPVVLYKLGYGYYVLDGNHRVAAAKELGQLEIDALVTEYVPLADTQAQRVFAERRAFEGATGLTRIGAVRPGTYPRLEDLIRTWAAAREGSPRDRDLRDAARRWESEVYRPVARRIRETHLIQKLPGERTADVFVHLAGLREKAAKATGQEPSWNDVIEHVLTNGEPDRP